MGAGKAYVLQVSEIPFDGGLRAFCEANLCGNYNRNYACPPSVGSAQELIERAKTYENALVFQTVSALEDSFDYEGMVDGMKRFQTLAAAIDHRLKNELEDYLMLSNEGCHKCKTCTYPDAPCRFPDELHPSIEAFGFNVSELACLGGINYINGPNTVTYFGGVCVIST
jgi:predicted metal-binding protein